MHNMQNFHDLLDHVRNHGTQQANRTGIDTLAVAGEMLKFDMAEGPAAITTKKLFDRAVVGELLGFFRGYTSAAQFRALGCNVWNQNANETPSWVKSPFRRGTDDLGRIYGSQWTDWQDTKIVPPEDVHLLPHYEALGYRVLGSLTGPDGTMDGLVIHRRINQLENALRQLLTDPTSRRIMITGWNPSDNDQVSLVACHFNYQFIANVKSRTLNLVLSMRSVDLYLGAPFNAYAGSVFLHIMARLTGFNPGTLTMFLGDTHLYVNHLSQVNEQLSRSHFPPPQIRLSDRIRRIEDVNDIPGVFTRIEPEDVWLEGYQSHPALRAPMAA